MLAESFTDRFREITETESLLEYSKYCEDIDTAITYAHQPRYMKGYPATENHSPQKTAERLDPYRQATQAAMWTGAIINRSKNNSKLSTASDCPNPSFEDIWKDTDLRHIAHDCEEALDELKPQTTNAITTIDVTKMKLSRESALMHGKPKEILTFAGWNGSGKDFMIGWLEKFLAYSGIPFQVIKMPNPDGQLFSTLNKFLHSKIDLSPNAAQLVFLADALDTEISEGKLTITNRFPTIESMVYGKKDLQPTILSLNPIFGSVFHTIIVDRHPAVAFYDVESRSTDKRVFEKKLDQILHQHSRFAELTELPGVRWLNADFNDHPRNKIFKSVRKMLDLVFDTGILQRELVSTGKHADFNSAWDFLNNAYWGFMKTEKLTLIKQDFS